MSRRSATATGDRGVKRMARAIDLFREMDNTIPSQVISVFLEVAGFPDGIETRQLPDRVRLTQASVSRAILYLSDTHWKDKSKTGLHLILRRAGSQDARQRVVKLSPKGRRLVRKIEATLDHEAAGNRSLV